MCFILGDGGPRRQADPTPYANPRAVRAALQVVAGRLRPPASGSDPGPRGAEPEARSAYRGAGATARAELVQLIEAFIQRSALAPEQKEAQDRPQTRRSAGPRGTPPRVGGRGPGWRPQEGLSGPELRLRGQATARRVRSQALPVAGAARGRRARVPRGPALLERLPEVRQGACRDAALGHFERGLRTQGACAGAAADVGLPAQQAQGASTAAGPLSSGHQPGFHCGLRGRGQPGGREDRRRSPSAFLAGGHAARRRNRPAPGQPEGLAEGGRDRPGGGILHPPEVERRGRQEAPGGLHWSLDHRPLKRLRLLRRVAPILLGSPGTVLPGVRRTEREGRADLSAARREGPAVFQVLAPGPGRNARAGGPPDAAARTADRAQRSLDRWGGVRPQEDGSHMPRLPADDDPTLDVREGARCRVDEQRGGASGAARGLPVEGEFRDPQRGQQPVRGAGADRGYDLRPVAAECAYLFHDVLYRKTLSHCRAHASTSKCSHYSLNGCQLMPIQYFRRIFPGEIDAHLLRTYCGVVASNINLLYDYYFVKALNYTIHNVHY